MNTWIGERFGETKLLAKQAFYSKLIDKSITKEKYMSTRRKYEKQSGAKPSVTNTSCT